jgi:site-specific recombinase XerD
MASKSRQKALARITLADLQSFAQFLGSLGLASISRARSLAAVKSLFGFCHRMRYVRINPAAELTLPTHENRLAEPILGVVPVHFLMFPAARLRYPN